MRREGAGRPRDPDIDDAIIQAALDEVAELGYADASMTGIARRAQVPKSTVYRRWESKQDLVIEAMNHLNPRAPAAPTGDARKDIYQQIDRLASQWQDPRASAVMLSLITEVSRNPPLYEVWEQRLVSNFRARMKGILATGVDTGQIRADVDVDLVIELALALPLHMRLRPTDVDLSGLAERFVSMLFDGVSGDAAS